MQLLINDTVKEIPFTLSAIKLGEYLHFNKKYEHLATEEDRALAWYTFFSGFDFFEVRNETFIQPAVEQYNLLSVLLNDTDELITDFSIPFSFNDEQWQMQDFKDCAFNDMSYNQLKLSRQIMFYMFKIQKGKLDSLIQLCAIFIRRPGEKFTEDIYEERMEFMKNLPLNIAMSVIHFLNYSQSIEKIIHLSLKGSK